MKLIKKVNRKCNVTHFQCVEFGNFFCCSTKRSGYTSMEMFTCMKECMKETQTHSRTHARARAQTHISWSNPSIIYS